MQVWAADGFKVCSVPSKCGKECVLRLQDTHDPSCWRRGQVGGETPSFVSPASPQLFLGCLLRFAVRVCFQVCVSHC